MSHDVAIASILTRLNNLDGPALLTLLETHNLLPQLLQELLLEAVLSDITVTPEVELNAYQGFYRQHQLVSDRDLQVWLDQQGWSKANLEQQVLRPIKLQQFKEQTWGKKVEAYFLKRKPQLDRVLYSLLRVKDMGMAQELFFRLQAGEQSFQDIAHTYSQGAEAQTGGLIGPVELSVPHPQLARRLLAAQPGQVLPPVQIAEWIIILRLEQFMPAQLDDAMRQRLINELFEQWLKQSIQAIQQQRQQTSTEQPDVIVTT